ncbi:MAG: hypothetical protein IPP51_07675 [Bacteroidetes bacterium]|nr:hypothetical protein [Bacteroidota bacterium]
MFGLWEEWLRLKNRYGLPTIKYEFLSARWLGKKSSTISAHFQQTKRKLLMLFVSTVSPRTLKLLKELLALPKLDEFYLAGGHEADQFICTNSICG